MTVWIFVAALAALQVKHFLCDFMLQSQFQLRHKGTYGHPGGILHSGLHALATTAVLWPFAGAGLLTGIVVAEFLVHYHIDWAKEQLTGRRQDVSEAAFWRLVGLDQLLHQITYAAILLVVFG